MKKGYFFAVKQAKTGVFSKGFINMRVNYPGSPHITCMRSAANDSAFF